MSDTSASEFEKIIMNDVEMRRAISRIAHELVERNDGAQELTLLGLRRRGGPIAQRIAERIREQEGVEPPVAELDVTDYRDAAAAAHNGDMAHFRSAFDRVAPGGHPDGPDATAFNKAAAAFSFSACGKGSRL